jgi:hypothetical protein
MLPCDMTACYISGLKKKQKSTLHQTRLGPVDLGEEFMRALLEVGFWPG